MARKESQKEFAGKKIIIRELRVKDIMALFDLAEVDGVDTMTAMRTHLEKFLPVVAEGLAFDDFLESTPSELEELFGWFMEVNQSFFTVAKKLGFDQVLGQMRAAMEKDLPSLYATSLQEVTAKQSGITDTASSVLP